MAVRPFATEPRLFSKKVNGFTFGLYCYFLVDFFLHMSARIPGYAKIRPTLLIVLVLTALLFLQKEKFKGWTQDPIIRAFLVLAGYLAISLPLVEWPGSVLRDNLSEFVKAIVFLLFTVLIIDTEKRLKIFIGIFVTCQVFRVLEPLYMNLTDGYLGSRTYLGQGEFAGRLSGAPSDVINPNELGFVIVTIIPFLHYLLWPGKTTRKLLYLALMGALLYALILTMSRGAFIALLVVAFMVFKESNHKLSLVAIAIAVAIGAWSIMTPIQKERYLSLVSDDTQQSATVEGRFRGMIGEFKLGLERPIVGHGLGTTREAKFHRYGETQASHSLYAELLIEIGVIGALLFLRFLFKIYLRLRGNWVEIKSDATKVAPFYSQLNKALIAVFWMYAVYSLNYWGLSQYYWYFFGGLALVFDRCVQFSRLNESVKDAKTSLGRRSKYPAAYKVRA